jgi:hypothetical protein
MCEKNLPGSTLEENRELFDEYRLHKGEDE